MARSFNVNGPCKPDRHYIVNLQSRLKEIGRMIADGDYFVISKARQYGKTTILRALAGYLKEEYQIVSIDFQNIESAEFMSGSTFVHALSREINKRIRQMEGVPDEVKKKLRFLADSRNPQARMAEMFAVFSEWCGQSEQPIVLLIDEIDIAADNQVFLDFLAQLRAAYLDRDETPAFQSVILAGVYDIRNIQRKIRPDEVHGENSPWNIAADFLVDMNFSVNDIAGMLEEYEADYHTGMDIVQLAELLYDYTSGYPYLVSRLCKLMDERIAETRGYPDKASAWTKSGCITAVKMLLEENNPLFDSLMNKLNQFPELKAVISRQLFQGQPVAYMADDTAVRNARMFGLVKVQNSTVMIANRIFEIRLYHRFLLDYSEQNREIYAEGSRQRNQFIVDGHLDVRRVLEKFVETFDYLYGDRGEDFLEEEGRRYFMLFLKPIINGSGNCYVEAETRNQERMDLVIDYQGEQSVCELKVWRGNAYNERGERQLAGYLDYFGLKKGYMLSFTFNKKKEIGIKEIRIGDKTLIEAVV